MPTKTNTQKIMQVIQAISIAVVVTIASILFGVALPIFGIFEGDFQGFLILIGMVATYLGTLLFLGRKPKKKEFIASNEKKFSLVVQDYFKGDLPSKKTELTDKIGEKFGILVTLFLEKFQVREFQCDKNFISDVAKILIKKKG